MTDGGELFALPESSGSCSRVIPYSVFRYANKVHDRIKTLAVLKR